MGYSLREAHLELMGVMGAMGNGANGSLVQLFPCLELRLIKIITEFNDLGWLGCDSREGT